MTDKAFKAWKDDYIEALTNAAGIAYILGEKDAAAVLHRLSVEAMGLDAKRKKKKHDEAAATEK